MIFFLNLLCSTRRFLFLFIFSVIILQHMLSLLIIKILDFSYLTLILHEYYFLH